jgi:thiamine-phosphate pyrophosphorylase
LGVETTADWAKLSVVHGLYPICDLEQLDQRGVDAWRFARALLQAQPALLQLRAKRASAQRVLELLERLGPACAQVGTRLIVNDRCDLALLAGAAGVHVGQDDVPLAAVRQLGPGLVVGLSTHTLDQLRAALQEQPDYVAFGPIFATGSKQHADLVVGVGQLARAGELARGAGIPLVAIGGIGAQQLSLVAPHTDAVAAIALLFPESPASAPDFYTEVTRIAVRCQDSLARSGVRHDANG